MKISKKCQYALKAIFELAWRNPDEPVKTRDIAASQQMSLRFTEIILNELKHGNFVESRRGNEGGYILARNAADLKVLDVIEYIEGPISVVANNIKDDERKNCPGKGAFMEFWDEINASVCKVCKEKSFKDLVEYEHTIMGKCAPNYTI